MDGRSRAIFLAYRLDNLTYEQITERTDLSVACVQRHITFAIAHIDREFTAMERRHLAS